MPIRHDLKIFCGTMFFNAASIWAACFGYTPCPKNVLWNDIFQCCFFKGSLKWLYALTKKTIFFRYISVSQALRILFFISSRIGIVCLFVSWFKIDFPQLSIHSFFSINWIVVFFNRHKHQCMPYLIR